MIDFGEETQISREYQVNFGLEKTEQQKKKPQSKEKSKKQKKKRHHHKQKLSKTLQIPFETPQISKDPQIPQDYSYDYNEMLSKHFQSLLLKEITPKQLIENGGLEEIEELNLSYISYLETISNSIISKLLFIEEILIEVKNMHNSKLTKLINEGYQKIRLGLQSTEDVEKQFGILFKV